MNQNSKRFLPVTHENLVLDDNGVSIDKKYVCKQEGKDLVSTEDIKKLSSLTGYDLPTASASVLGGVKIGSGLVIADGVLSTNSEGGAADTVEWDNIQNKPTKFVPTSHNHDALYATKDSEHAHDNKDALNLITDEMIESWNNKSDFSGAYKDLTNKPTIPTVTNDLTNELKEQYDSAVNHSKEAHDYAPANHKHNEYLTEHQDIATKVDKEEGKSLLQDTEIARLATLKNYSLTAATDTKLGGVKVGDGLTITAGVLSVNAQGTSSVEWNAIQSKPEAFVPADHEHETYATKQELADALGDIITLLGGI